jgi:hypothetical protein
MRTNKLFQEQEVKWELEAHTPAYTSYSLKSFLPLLLSSYLVVCSQFLLFLLLLFKVFFLKITANNSTVHTRAQATEANWLRDVQ